MEKVETEDHSVHVAKLLEASQILADLESTKPVSIKTESSSSSTENSSSTTMATTSSPMSKNNNNTCAAAVTATAGPADRNSPTISSSGSTASCVSIDSDISSKRFNNDAVSSARLSSRKGSDDSSPDNIIIIGSPSHLDQQQNYLELQEQKEKTVAESAGGVEENGIAVRMVSQVQANATQFPVDYAAKSPWHPSYVRTRHRNLRCFPCCSVTHKESSFCGVPISVQINGIANSNDWFILGSLRRLNDPLLLRVGAVVPDIIPDIFRSNRIIVGQTSPSSSSIYDFVPPRRWKYNCRLAKHTARQSHLFTLYICDKATRVCRQVANGPTFQIKSAWRQNSGTVPRPSYMVAGSPSIIKHHSAADALFKNASLGANKKRPMPMHVSPAMGMSNMGMPFGAEQAVTMFGSGVGMPLGFGHGGQHSATMMYQNQMVQQQQHQQQHPLMYVGGDGGGFAHGGMGMSGMNGIPMYASSSAGMSHPVRGGVISAKPVTKVDATASAKAGPSSLISLAVAVPSISMMMRTPAVKAVVDATSLLIAESGAVAPSVLANVSTVTAVDKSELNGEVQEVVTEITETTAVAGAQLIIQSPQTQQQQPQVLLQQQYLQQQQQQQQLYQQYQPHQQQLQYIQQQPIQRVLVGAPQQQMIGYPHQHQQPQYVMMQPPPQPAMQFINTGGAGFAPPVYNVNNGMAPFGQQHQHSIHPQLNSQYVYMAAPSSDAAKRQRV